MIRRTVTHPESLFLFLAALFACILAALTFGLYVDGREKGRKELRAYLGLQNFGVRMVPTGAGPMPQIFMDIVNSGNTPARQVRIALAFSNPQTADIFDFPLPAFGRGRRPLPPGGKWTVQRLVRGIGNIDITQVNQTTRILTWGRISYFDIFDVEQTVDFRMQTDEISFVNGAIVGWTLAATEDGNDTS